MTKREKIKEVYYKYFDKEDVDITMHISVNGYIEKENLKLIKQVGFLENFEIEQFRCRPIELKGIENNNGWIKIESKDNLPKESGTYHVIYENSFNNIGREHFYLKGVGWDSFLKVTHYQPIIKPKPPIY